MVFCWGVFEFVFFHDFVFLLFTFFGMTIFFVTTARIGVQWLSFLLSHFTFGLKNLTWFTARASALCGPKVAFTDCFTALAMFNKLLLPL